MTGRLILLTAAGAAVLVALAWSAFASLPPAASRAELATLTRPSKPGFGLCLGGKGVATRCDAVPSTSTRTMEALRTHARRFSRCMAAHRSPVGTPRFTRTEGGFSVSFPQYDFRRHGFRAAYARCGSLLSP